MPGLVMRVRSLASNLGLFFAMSLGCFKAGSDEDDVGDETTETGADPVCGNAIVEDGEACDDGNDVDTDACLNSCSAATCGDGYVQDGVEPCDDGNASGGDGCSATCTLESCGDGIVQDPEECDDGNTVPTDECLTTCIAASCGDGFVQADVEACDDGNDVDTDSCVGTCEEASCGDGFVQAGVEPCDDGNLEDTDACLSTCTNASCGDGFVEEGIEECDDGNGTAGDGCSVDCLAECGTDCWGAEGCYTAANRCIRFSCRAALAGGDFCDACMGWNEVTYDQWLNGGYCSDVSAKYRMEYGYATACGNESLSCCADQAACGGGDNAWHFWNGAETFYVGPCLGCMEADNCTFWNNVAGGNVSRITVCERQL
jgi:cysteine-rich repeat protein